MFTRSSIWLARQLSHLQATAKQTGEEWGKCVECG